MRPNHDRTSVREGGWCGEVRNGFSVLSASADDLTGDFKSSKFDTFHGESEFAGV